MELQKLFYRTLPVVGMSALIISCAKPNTEPPAAPAPLAPTTIVSTPPTAGNDNHPLNTQAGSTVDIVLDGTSYQEKLQKLTNYVVTHPLNAPVNFKLNVQMSDIGGGKYAGYMQLGYYDYDSPTSGRYYISVVETGTGVNDFSYNNYVTGYSDAEYNRWFAWNAKQVFHAFFQDVPDTNGSIYNAVVLVIDDGLNLGDGGGNAKLSGSLWVKTFQTTISHDVPELKCWFLFAGPYQCRTFIGGNGQVNTYSALYPSTANGYWKLGTFTGLDKAKAFGQ